MTIINTYTVIPSFTRGIRSEKIALSEIHVYRGLWFNTKKKIQIIWIYHFNSKNPLCRITCFFFTENTSIVFWVAYFLLRSCKIGTFITPNAVFVWPTVKTRWRLRYVHTYSCLPINMYVRNVVMDWIRVNRGILTRNLKFALKRNRT